MQSEKVLPSLTSPDMTGRRPRSLSALSKTCALALLGDGLTCIVEAVVAYTTVGISLMGLTPLLTFALIALITGSLLLRHVRGAQIAGIIVGILTFSYLIVPATRSGLIQPTTSASHFGLLAVTFGFALVAIITGIAAKMQSGQAATPKWLPSFLSAMIGLVVGMILIVSFIASTPQSGASATTTDGTPTVHTAGGRFLTNVVLVPKGGQLVIADDDGEEHIIQNGSWTAHGTAQSQPESGAPTVSLDIKGGSHVFGPFNTAGVYHLFCPIHLHMNLTVVVQ